MKRLLLPLVLLAAAGCATSSAFRSGENAERLQDYDRAVLEYQKAVRGAPDDVQYRRALERARMRASLDHTNLARRLAGRGLYAEALAEYRLAFELDPKAAAGVEEEMRDLEARRQQGAATLQEAKARARERALPGLTWAPTHSSRSGSCSAAPACGRPTSPSRGPRESTSPSTPRSRTRPSASTSRAWASTRP